MRVEGRALDLDAVVLAKGNHETREQGVCALEAVAWLAGEKHTDHPECVCPVIGAFARQWNDDLDDATRQKLKPYLARMIGTRSTKAVESKRAWLVTDWMVRVHTPAWLELGGMKDRADALRSLAPLTSAALAKNAQPRIAEARTGAAAAWAAARAAARAAAWDGAGAAAWDAAWAAAWAAARDAAWAAAWDAAWAAAWAAARDAAWAAAWDAARDAAWDAARAAAWAAAWDAARAAAQEKLAPTVESLQGSAFRLLDSLIEAGR